MDALLSSSLVKGLTLQTSLTSYKLYDSQPLSQATLSYSTMCVAHDQRWEWPGNKSFFLSGDFHVSIDGTTGI